MKPSRSLPASCLKRSSLLSPPSSLPGGRELGGGAVRSGSVSTGGASTGGADGASASGCVPPSRPDPSLSRGISRSPLAATRSPSFFAFLRILTRSTMGYLETMLARRGGDAGGVDGQGVVAEGVEQRGRGQGVDHARDAAADGVDLANGLGAERIPRSARHPDAVLDVAGRVVLVQRTEAVAHTDALAQRRVGGALEARLQFRLPDQQHREQILIVELEVRQQADLVERLLRRDELRLVEDQHRLALLLVQLEQLRVDAVQQLVAETRRLDAEGRGDRAQELGGGEAWIDQQDHRPRVADAHDQRA